MPIVFCWSLFVGVVGLVVFLALIDEHLFLFVFIDGFSILTAGCCYTSVLLVLDGACWYVVNVSRDFLILGTYRC